MIIHTLFPSWYLVENPSMIIISKINGENSLKLTMVINRQFYNKQNIYNLINVLLRWKSGGSYNHFRCKDILYQVFNWDYLLFKSRINKGIVSNYLLVFKHYMSSSYVDQIQDCTVSLFLCFKCDTLHTLQSICFNSRRYFRMSSSCSSFPIVWRFHQEFLPEASF